LCERSEPVGIEWLSATRVVLSEGFLGELLELARFPCECGIPKTLNRHLFKDGGREGVLSIGWKLGGLLKGLVEELGHAVESKYMGGW